MKPFSLLIKPAGADCNLNCEYCFYAVKKSLYPDSASHRMSTAVLERLVSSFMATPQGIHAFGWQGGEPTLMGLDFFRQLTDFQKQYGAHGAMVSNGLQTNGSLITDDMAEHFARHHFLLGVSLDGPPELHDLYRRTHDERPTHAAVMQGIERLRKRQVDFNILVLVSAANVRHARTVYRYLRDQGFLFQQYIPCVEYDAQGKLLPFSITGRQWGDFLCGIFDEWIKHDTRRVSVRHFDSVLARMVENTATVCHMDRNCCQYFVVEHNGDVFPCDFFVRPELKLGNIMHDSWDAMLASPVYHTFGAKKSQWNPCCAQCRHAALCAGDCLKHRLNDLAAPGTLSTLCAGWRQFYDHTTGAFRKLADEVRAERVQAQMERYRTA